MSSDKGLTPGRTFRFAFLFCAVLCSCFGPGCIQDYALEPIATVAGGRIGTDPAGGNVTGVRVNMVGTTTDQEPGTPDYDFCDVEGDFLLKTQRLGRGWVVARGIDYDIGYDNVYLPSFGSSDSIDRLIPATDTVTLFEKTAGSALFLVFEQDFGPLTSVHLVGDFCDWELSSGARALRDDGLEGDYQAGDGVWTLRTDLPSGEQEYGFILNMDEDKIWRDPYEEKSSGGKSVILVK